MKVLAIDQGTSSTRGLLVETTGSPGGTIVYRSGHQQYYPQNGYVEHDPEELLRHIRECIAAAGPVDAIGIDNQGESCLAWDSLSGRAISPVIVWQDRRTKAMLSQLRSAEAEALVFERSGLSLDAYFSASKFSWILENIPEAKSLLARGRLHLGTSDSFFIQRLTGEFCTDISTASRTALLNIETGQWDADLCDLFSIPMQTLPEIRPSMGHFGDVKTGTQSTPITAACVDQQAALYVHGCRKPGDSKITFGTGAFALSLTGDHIYRPADNSLLPTIAWQAQGKPPTYALDGAVYCAGSALNWAKSLGLFSQFEEINHFSNAPAIEQKLVFVPALNGLASPYWDSTAAGLWLGMSLSTAPKQLVQAILEGIAFRSGQVMDAMNRQIPLGNQISIDGGVSENPYFCQFLSDVLQKQIHALNDTELTALGVAMMAGAIPAESTGAGGHIYEPRHDQSTGIVDFAEAVNRSRNWHAVGS